MYLNYTENGRTESMEITHDNNIYQFAIDRLGQYYDGAEMADLCDEEGNDKEDITDTDIANAFVNHYGGFSVTDEPKGTVVYR